MQVLEGLEQGFGIDLYSAHLKEGLGCVMALDGFGERIRHVLHD
jgi:hypothetical protein